MLAVYESIKHFRHLVEGRDLIIKTNHKLLTYAFKQRLDKASPRQARHLDFISQFSTNIMHISGQQNNVADAFSRIETIDTPVIVTTEQLAEKQKQDEELTKILQETTALNLQKFTLPETSQSLYCECSQNIVRPYVPVILRRRIFDVVHNLSHSSGRTTSRQIRQKFVWPNMDKDIRS